MESGAYGAAKAGGSFDLRSFLTKPQVVARALCMIFALIVFSCIFGEGYSNTSESSQLYCVFNQNEDACRYGCAIGVLAFLASAFFFVVDIYFPQISNATDRKYLVIGDLLFSGCAGLPGLPALQGRSGGLHPELRGPHSRPQHGLHLLPWRVCGQLPAAALHPECGDHRGLPAAPCVLSGLGEGAAGARLPSAPHLSRPTGWTAHLPAAHPKCLCPSAICAKRWLGKKGFFS
ncbi:synaptogyrin-2 isoform X2 [Dipodomys spectabilis]|uniref:synaptogyrin-2 isoform X2 n=1 Tax=Dipodomys spectabilis TaxID=105255 RepID=UPI001C54A756|nr:synaptogyrin-2 isoform X2 [Dipodomys spectabilis]